MLQAALFGIKPFLNQGKPLIESQRAPIFWAKLGQMAQTKSLKTRYWLYNGGFLFTHFFSGA
jgi:hypothetical protein